MAIDLAREQLLPLRAVPGWLHQRGVCGQNNRPLSLTVIYDWVRSGRLEVVKLGRLFTTTAALARMASVEGERADLSPPAQKQRRKRKRSRPDEDAHAETLAKLRARGFKV